VPLLLRSKICWARCCCSLCSCSAPISSLACVCHRTGAKAWPAVQSRCGWQGAYAGSSVLHSCFQFRGDSQQGCRGLCQLRHLERIAGTYHSIIGRASSVQIDHSLSCIVSRVPSLIVRDPSPYDAQILDAFQVRVAAAAAALAADRGKLKSRSV